MDGEEKGEENNRDHRQRRGIEIEELRKTSPLLFQACEAISIDDIAAIDYWKF